MSVVGSVVHVVMTSEQQLRNSWQFVEQEHVGGFPIQEPVTQHSVIPAAAHVPMATREQVYMHICTIEQMLQQTKCR